MNLLYHIDHSGESVTVNSEVAKKIVSNAVSPVVAVTSTSLLDSHLQEAYGLHSMYMLLRFFGDCVTDRDQENETETNFKGRPRSNSLFQRESSTFVRFTRPLIDLVDVRVSDHGMLFDYHSLELFLDKYLRLVDHRVSVNTPHRLLKHSIYHKFFTAAISSTAYLSPYESFNHPVMSLLALDISRGDTYENARDLLIRFKNMNSATKSAASFPTFININDILPVFLLCYNDSSREQFEACQSLAKMLKKQLFVESILLPLWRDSEDYDAEEPKRILHPPIMSSLEEMLYFLDLEAPGEDNISYTGSSNPISSFELPLALVETIYDRLNLLITELMIPFMKRKISFWEETILQPRKSIFLNAKFLRRFVSKSAPATPAAPINSKSDGAVQRSNFFPASSNEFLLRKLADWSFMLSDYRTAYATYDTLSKDLEHHLEYLAPCLEWCAVSVLMGAQSIVTVKMIKNDIDPLISKSLQCYEKCASKLTSPRVAEADSPVDSKPAQSYETRCMLLSAELFLSLSDTWTATPYAIKYLETILQNCPLGPKSQVLLWEKLAYCYELRVDPRVSHIHAKQRHLQYEREEAISKSNERAPQHCSESHFPTEKNQTGNQEEQSDTDSKDEALSNREKEPADFVNPNKLPHKDIALLGLTRRRKAAFFRLIAANKWCEQKQWKQASWLLRDVDTVYSGLGFSYRKGLILERLVGEIEANMHA